MVYNAGRRYGRPALFHSSADGGGNEGPAMINLHYWPTPNGKKVTIFLEEAGVAYTVIPCNIGAGDQFKPDFLAINPNHRMPTMVDDAPAGGGAPISVFESGAILLYLAEKFGQFWPQDLRTKYDVVQWVFWQMANQGPKLGEAGHFIRAGARMATCPTRCAASPTRPTGCTAC
jgi:GST-like protein